MPRKRAQALAAPRTIRSRRDGAIASTCHIVTADGTCSGFHLRLRPALRCASGTALRREPLSVVVTAKHALPSPTRARGEVTTGDYGGRSASWAALDPTKLWIASAHQDLALCAVELGAPSATPLYVMSGDADHKTTRLAIVHHEEGRTKRLTPTSAVFASHTGIFLTDAITGEGSSGAPVFCAGSWCVMGVVTSLNSVRIDAREVPLLECAFLDPFLDELAQLGYEPA